MIVPTTRTLYTRRRLLEKIETVWLSPHPAVPIPPHSIPSMTGICTFCDCEFDCNKVDFEHNDHAFCSESCLNQYTSGFCSECEELVCVCGEHGEYDNAEVLCETCECFDCRCVDAHIDAHNAVYYDVYSDEEE
jgi:hypothetical protein